jgi:hypothetical protein
MGAHRSVSEVSDAEALSRVQGVLPGVHVPRLLAFYQESRDGDAATSDWQPVAWGLTFENGSVLTVPVDRPVAVTLWRSLSDAEEALDASVATPTPGLGTSDRRQAETAAEGDEA